MSIDSTPPISPLSPIQGSEVGTVQTQKTKATGTGSTPAEETQVNLSDAQASLHQASSLDIDSAKVDSIKQSIRNGDLKVNTGKIADALIAQTQSMLDDAE
jgi:negative regulator of flagellin synthesis FlgM